MTARDVHPAREHFAARLGLVGEPTRRAIVVAAVVAGAVWTAVMLLRLFMGGAVGMGNNWDGDRLMCPLGLANDRPWDGNKQGHVYLTWVAQTRYDESCVAGGLGVRYFSSQQLVLWLAKVLNPMLDMPGALDLRTVGLLLTLAFGAVTALLVVLLPGPLSARFSVASAFGLIMCDSVFADFFISPYSEPAALIGLMLLCPALLLLWRRTHSTLSGIVLTTVVLLFIITAKPQLVSLLPVGLAALLWLPCVRRKSDQAHFRPSAKGPQRLGRWLAVRWPALVACAVLCGVTGAFSVTQPQRLSQQVWYNAVFAEMLPHSPDPAGDLKALGADPRLVPASTSRMGDSNSAVRTPYWEEFERNVTPGKILVHYLTHPARLVGMGGRGVQAMTHPTLEHYLGSYPPDSGQPPLTKERRVVVVTTIFDFFRSMPALVPLLWLCALGMGAVLASRTWARPSARAVGRMTVCVVLSLFLQFWLVMVTEGAADIYKHMIFTDYLTALCIPLSIFCLWLLIRRQHAERFEQVHEGTACTVPGGRKPLVRPAPSLTSAGRDCS